MFTIIFANVKKKYKKENTINIYTILKFLKCNSWYKSMNVIRWKHKTNCQKSKKADIGSIYQQDMVLTQFGFIGYILIMPEVFGLRNKPEEDEAFNHFWRVTGYMLGIPNR